MTNREKTNLAHMHTTGNDIAMVFARALDEESISAMQQALLELIKSQHCPESRMMVLGALAALGHGTVAPGACIESPAPAS